MNWLAARQILTPDAFENMMADVWAEVNRLTTRQALAQAPYPQYQDDPLGFCTNVLGDTFAPDVIPVMESVRDHPVTIARSANATGKTHCAARIAIWWYKCFDGAQVYTCAAPPEGNLKKLLWGEISNVLARNEGLFVNDAVSTASMNVARSRDGLKAANDFITGVTIPGSGKPEEREARFSGKHAPHLLFIVDEGDAVPFEVYKGIEACMSGGHARLLVMFNPRAKSGPVYRMESNGEGHVVPLNALNHPNVVTGTNQIPGAVDRETTVRRFNEWTRPLAPTEEEDDLCVPVPDYLIGVVAHSKAGIPYPPLPGGLRRITDPAFCYMVLGEYPPQGSDQLISEEWLTNARARWNAYVALYGEKPPPLTRPILGVDVAEFGDDSNVACLRYGGWVPHVQTWSGVDTLTTGDKVADLFRTYDPSYVYVDATGIGTGVAPQAGRNLRARPPVKRRNVRPGLIASVKTAETPTEKIEIGEFNKLRDQLWWKVREWLRTDPGAMLPPDDELLEELLVPTYAVLNGKIHVMKKEDMKKLLGGRSPDRADALCLTFAPEERSFKIGFA